MMIEKTLVMVGWFLAQCVDAEGNGTYNVLFEELNIASSKRRAHNLIAHWTKDPNEFKAGQIYNLNITGQCTKVYEVLEGNGKRGTAWAPEDDWYVNGQPYICNSIKVTYESRANLVPCDDFSIYCSICKD